MEMHCPICQTTLKESRKLRQSMYLSSPPPEPKYWTDYTCLYGINHSYSIRFLEGELVKSKVRLQEGNEKIFFLLNFQENKVELWTQPGQTNRVTVPGVFEPDFTDIPKLRDKLKTYLIFA